MHHAPKIFKETCKIPWHKRSIEVRNFVRGLSPYPAAWTNINGKTFKIFKVEIADVKHASESAFVTDQKNYLHFKTADGWISIEEIQPEGKKRMMVQEFLRGNMLTP